MKVNVQITYLQEKEYCMLAVWDLQYQKGSFYEKIARGSAIPIEQLQVPERGSSYPAKLCDFL